MIIAPAVQGLLVAKVRGIYASNRLLFGLTCWILTYGTVLLIVEHFLMNVLLQLISKQWRLNRLYDFGARQLIVITDTI